MKKSDHSSNWLLLWTTNSFLPAFCLGKIFSKKCCLGKQVTSLSLDGDEKNLGDSFAWGSWVNCLDSIFFDSQISSSNVNNINLKIFWAIVGYTSLREKSTQILERNKPLACLRNMTECMLEIRRERLLWKLYTIRAYSTPILCSTIECCPLLQKLCIALFLWKTLWRGIE